VRPGTGRPPLGNKENRLNTQPTQPGPIQVAQLDLDGPEGGVLSFGPALGTGPAIAAGDVYALVRLNGRPAATLVAPVAEDEEPAEAVAAAARELFARTGIPEPDPLLAPPAPGPAPAAADPAPDGEREPPGAGARPLPRKGRPGGKQNRAAKGRAARGPAAAVPAAPAAPDPVPAADPVPLPVPPRTSVVISTRERADQLARAIDSLLDQDHPDFEIVVVDNAPATSATEDLIDGKYAALGVRYVREAVPGLAIAHNRGVAVATGEIIAFTDDDVIADPHWLTALTLPFAADPGLGCTTGLILPARLGTPAQVLLESHGGFAKGFAPQTWDPAAPPADDPLFPFTAGSFGSGANMAFRAGVLRATGGFDPATGTGTPARGGDDLYGFVSVLVAGHRLRYTPEALVWHHHRETWKDLENQAYGYGAGLTAFLTATLVRRPSLLPSLLRKLPGGLARARTITAARDSGGAAVPGAHGAQDYPWPRELSRLERRGMLAGPLGYAKARLRVRGVRTPWDPREHQGRTGTPATAGTRPAPHDGNAAAPAASGRPEEPERREQEQ
jgi:O-antigen biosynthesis protein